MGSGVIFVSKTGESVRGLTTAASIWATAATGIAVGLGHYVLAVGATLLLLHVLRGMARFDLDEDGLNGEEPLVGFEPTTARLRIESSTPELQWRFSSKK